jgi:hypothetical protein
MAKSVKIDRPSKLSEIRNIIVPIQSHEWYELIFLSAIINMNEFMQFIVRKTKYMGVKINIINCSFLILSEIVVAKLTNDIERNNAEPNSKRYFRFIKRWSLFPYHKSNMERK